MKPVTTIVVAVVCLFTVACKSKIAMDYNDMIVKKQNTLGARMHEAEPQLRTFFTSFQYDSIVSVSTRMENFIDTIIADLSKKPAPKASQGENFKKAALHYFTYMKSIYTSYKNYGSQTTPEGRMIAQVIIPKVTSQENQKISEMQEAQKIFAKNNGFKIRAAKQPPAQP